MRLLSQPDNTKLKPCLGLRSHPSTRLLGARHVITGVIVHSRDACIFVDFLLSSIVDVLLMPLLDDYDEECR